MRTVEEVVKSSDIEQRTKGHFVERLIHSEIDRFGDIAHVLYAFEVGLARSAAELGRSGEAVKHYRRRLDIWSRADPRLPVLMEAREYVEAHR